jgi:hypothetical protein
MIVYSVHGWRHFLVCTYVLHFVCFGEETWNCMHFLVILSLKTLWAGVKHWRTALHRFYVYRKRKQDSSAPRHFGTRWKRQFDTKTVRHQNISAPRKFGIRTNRHRIFFQTNVITFFKIKSTEVKKTSMII